MDTVTALSMIDQLERVRAMLNDSEDILSNLRDYSSLEGKQQINQTIGTIRGAVNQVISLEESIV